ncbi:hydroxycarboxylic acid receptor 2 [Misgurnus anguillicaudatus]|uniref:hydroxycarboxylic acid receptor 2 n=1 Tax=Misgurnus anguillicaudatus TaxID=75329 RepID=UPI002435C163|nr:hydroxycarboxylic acid receptor 2-like [Misgurnus anguillicaudatus]
MTSNNTTHHIKLDSSILPPVLIVEFLLGLPGNAMALWVFGKKMKSWRVNVMFLFNLVLSDVLLILGLPFRIDSYLRDETWIFGDAWCRINLFMLAVNRSASIAFMTAVAFDRYFKVVHPHHVINHMNLKQATLIACFIWGVVIGLRTPLLANNLLSNTSHCRSFSESPSLGIRLHYAVFIFEFFVPLILLVFCSVRIACILHSRRMDKGKRGQKAIRTVLIIVGVFIFCFSPSVATVFIGLYLKSLGKDVSNPENLMSQWFQISLAFTYLNSALDPVIYCFSSSIFRNALKRTINRTGFLQLQLSRRDSMQSGND